jgi:hypothetical protein
MAVAARRISTPALAIRAAPPQTFDDELDVDYRKYGDKPVLFANPTIFDGSPSRWQADVSVGALRM